MTENTTVTTTDADATETKAPKAKDFTSYAAKAPTSLHSHYAGWLKDKTGLQFDGVSEADLAKLVQLSVVLYHDYQASDENKARKAAEAAGKAPKVPSKVAQEKAELEAKVAQLQAELEAAKATPANGSPAPSAAGEASTKPVGRKTAAKTAAK